MTNYNYKDDRFDGLGLNLLIGCEPFQDFVDTFRLRSPISDTASIVDLVINFNFKNPGS